MATDILPGMRGGGIDKTTLVPKFSILNKGVRILETFRKQSGIILS